MMCFRQCGMSQGIDAVNGPDDSMGRPLVQWKNGLLDKLHARKGCGQVVTGTQGPMGVR